MIYMKVFSTFNETFKGEEQKWGGKETKGETDRAGMSDYELCLEGMGKSKGKDQWNGRHTKTGRVGRNAVPFAIHLQILESKFSNM